MNYVICRTSSSGLWGIIQYKCNIYGCLRYEKPCHFSAMKFKDLTSPHKHDQRACLNADFAGHIPLKIVVWHWSEIHV